MTDTLLDLLENKIDALLAENKSLRLENKQLTNQLDQDQRIGAHKYNELIQRCATLELQHKELGEHLKKSRDKEQLAVQNRIKIAQLNQQTRSQVEKMIARLKTLEQNA